MGFVENMKWWQWILLSLLVGAALAYSNSNMDLPVVHRSMSGSDFERNLLRDPLGTSKMPWVNDIMVYPPQLVERGNKMVPMQIVTFHCIVVQPDHPEDAKSDFFSMLAPVPYVPMPRWPARRDDGYPGITIYTGKTGDTLTSIARDQYGKDTSEGERAIVAANPDLREAQSWSMMKINAGQEYAIPWDPDANPPHTIADFLNEAAKTGLPVKFRYGWWQSPTYAYPIWMGGSFLIIGLVFPLLIRMMLRGGLGREKEGYDLSRFRHEPEPAKAPTAPVVTAMDMQQLRELEDNMAASLKAGAVGQSGEAQVAAQAPAAAAVKKLTGGPAEIAAADKAKEEKAYTGEFYPVEKPAGKKKE